jgi:peptide-methionine (S)-S-oxide reductase
MVFATFGAGCFWGVQEEFHKLKGVIDTSVGYMGGTTKNPSYQEVCSNKTGHAEVVQITYDPDTISYNTLLNKFFEIHDPTQKNKQGPDIGTQYRSVIFYHNNKQKILAEKTIKFLNKSNNYLKRIETEISPASTFYKAEDYHQHYFQKNNKSSCRIF